MIHLNNKGVFWATLLATGLNITIAQAAVSADEAAKLGNELTPFGAERQGSADGTIPSWTPDPIDFAQVLQDKTRLTITANNYQQHADHLVEGQIAMFEKYPDSFEMKVYPSRRTQRLPQWVYANIKDNAINARLADNGNGVENAYGGAPFPIPQNGSEVMWNHILRWRGQGHHTETAVFTVYGDGNISKTVNEISETVSYYKQGGQDDFNDLVGFFYMETKEPSRRRGEVLLVHEPLNQAINPRKAWQYIPGQRRVRRAPTVAYDTPTPSSNGINVYDESFQFNGAQDRYDWELVGKKAVYIPYNDNNFINALDNGVTQEELLTPHHPNPEYKRWELHRVWVVEGTVKDDQRHVYAKRRFYMDEDSWQILMSESYDARDKLWKFTYSSPYYVEELPGLVMDGNIHQDLLSGNYVLDQYMRRNFTDGQDESSYTVQHVRRQARR